MSSPSQDIHPPLAIDGPTAPVPLLASDWREMVRAMSLLKGEEEGVFGVTTKTSCAYRPLPAELRWHGGIPPYHVAIADRRFSCAETSLAVFNLETGRRIPWRVSDAVGAVAEGMLETAPAPRLILMPVPSRGPVNVRDVGGWEWRLDGRRGRLRQGVLFRGSADGEFLPGCAENRRFVREVLRIRTDLDLRYPWNVADRTGSDFGPELAWRWHPVNAYDSFTGEQCAIWRDAVADFADPAMYPMYIHCSGGVDRTGEMVFLLQGLCGVSYDDLLLDYELSSMAGFPRPRDIPYFQEWLGHLRAYAPPAAPWPKTIESYLLAIGVSAAQLRAIREILTGESFR